MDAIEINKRKMNFFQRFLYALTKPHKYKELSEDGIKKAIVYFFILVVIVSLFFTVSTMLTTQNLLSEGVQLFEDGKQPTYEYMYSYCFTTYFLSTLITNFIYLIILAVMGWIISKIFKLNLKFKEMITFAIYSLTLPSIVYIIYAIVSYFVSLSQNVSVIVNDIYIFSMYIYFFIALIVLWKKNK